MNCILMTKYSKMEVVLNSIKNMERWLSGRKRRIANPLYSLFCTEGSNPFLSDFHPRSEGNFCQLIIARKRAAVLQYIYNYLQVQFKHPMRFAKK